MAVGGTVTDTTGSMGQLQITRGGGTRPVVFTFSVPGVATGLTTGGAAGTVACVPGAFTQAQEHSESMTRAARIRKSGIVLRFIASILIWQENMDMIANYPIDGEFNELPECYWNL